MTYFMYEMNHLENSSAILKLLFKQIMSHLSVKTAFVKLIFLVYFMMRVNVSIKVNTPAEQLQFIML